jgi:hypothetical protein
MMRGISGVNAGVTATTALSLLVPASKFVVEPSLVDPESVAVSSPFCALESAAVEEHP